MTPVVPIDDGAFLRTLTLLYVEDEAVTRLQMSELLRGRVGTLLVANDGQAAMTCYRDRRPHLVLTDLELPGIDGFSLASEIVRDGTRVPVMVTTSYEEPDFLLRAIDLGVAKYLVKPVDVAKLDTALLECAHRINVETQHHALSARLAQVVDASTDGFWERDLLGVLVLHSARFNELLGLPAVDTIAGGDEFKARIHPEDFRRIEPQYQAVNSGQLERFSSEFRVRHQDGSWKWLRSRGKVVARADDGKPTRVAGAVTDITAQKEAEAELRASEERFRALAERSPVGVFETDAQGRNTYLNPVALSMMGAGEAQVRGLGWLDFIHADDRARVRQAWAEAVLHSRASSGLFRVVRPGGQTLSARADSTALRDANGRVTGFIGVLVDQTEHQALQEERALSARLATMSTMVAGVAHQTNNPLTAVIATQSWVTQEVRKLGEALRSTVPLDREQHAKQTDEIVEALTDAARASERIASIVRDLALVGKAESSHARVGLAAVAQRVIDALPPTLVGECTVRLDDLRPPDVVASAGQLEQLINNLVINALQAVAAKRGTVVVRVGPGQPGFARLEVIDDGIGIAPEVVNRIFDPFFTTHQVGDGMGLGLAVARSIVHGHGGTISCQSATNQGSTFRVELPVFV